MLELVEYKTQHAVANSIYLMKRTTRISQILQVKLQTASDGLTGLVSVRKLSLRRPKAEGFISRCMRRIKGILRLAITTTRLVCACPKLGCQHTHVSDRARSQRPSIR
jgi:hypothetical protein